MFLLYWLVCANASSPIKQNTFQWKSSESISDADGHILEFSGTARVETIRSKLLLIV